MPCNSDYLNQTGTEASLQRTAILFVYALEHCGLHVPAGVKRAAEDCYCRTDFISELCAFLRQVKAMRPEEFERIVYNAKDKTSRDLADWWEEHQRADEARQNLYADAYTDAIKKAKP